MAFDDIFKLLSVREGTPQGNAIENRMIGAMGGPETIRKKFQNNPDGSVVMAHTRGPGTQPEFITTLVEQIAGLFGWPWHGLERLATAGGRTTETPSGEFATKGTSPESVNSRAFNFVLSRPAADEFAAIPPPASDPALTTWGNWAGISNGVLFGEDVGMNVWLYTANDKCWVVKMTLSGVATATLDFYTLSNWVAGMPADTAPNWVSYDGTPTPYMVTAKPSAAGRTAVKTVMLDIPAYYRTSEGVVTVKRGCVSFDGSKIILAHEVNEPDSLLFAWIGNAGRSALFVEDQWNEIVITGDASATLDASISIKFQQASTGESITIITDDIIGDERLSSGSSYGPWDASKFYENAIHQKTVSTYMYTPSSVAEQVVIDFISGSRLEIHLTGVTSAMAMTYKSYIYDAVRLEFDGNKTDIEKQTGDFYDVSGTVAFLTGHTFTGTLTNSQRLYVNGSLIGEDVSSSGPGSISSVRLDTTASYGTPPTKWMLKVGGHWLYTGSTVTPTYTAFYRTYGAAMQNTINHDLTSDAAPSSIYVVGEKRWFPIAYIISHIPVAGGTTRIELTRDAFDLFTISYVTQDGSEVRIDSGPVTHLTPYGWFDVLADAVPKLAFEGSTCFSAVDGSAATFDADGRNAGSGTVKYAKYDVDTYQAQRHV